MPFSLQPCSSSPMSLRFGSADSVVLPVPDRPKNTAVSPSSPMLAEQCIGSTPSAGSRKFMTEKTDFFISPAYWLPAMTTTFFSKLTQMAASECTPSSSGMHLQPGAQMTVKSSEKLANSSAVGRMSRSCMNMF